ncbi:PQQ-like beta-propeller repeat protein [Maliponia aquimaris]|uniref:Outer membrane protein assembly factor BamB n=1 Tax=Maliponia aquimaris TaxID=1673631 RepID=A0A238L5U2_9RHOB|nr:PQQ-like beta-propeller repeat protein [Maliponia aquimaris]SMX50483.1 Outer membrane protein assembly factor BamB precursor [Maliponia aquimaris]
MLRKTSLLISLAALLAAGCSERETILPGERMNVRDALTGDYADGTAPEEVEVPQARAFSAPAMTTNTDWAQSPVSPHVRVTHPALGQNLTQAFAVSIGAGDGRKTRLNVDPIVAGGRIFTMDSDHRVQATALSGQALWTAALVPQRDKAPEGQGGGLAYGEGTLFVSSGFGKLTALDPATGGKLWEQDLDNTATGAPSYRDGLVYVVSGDRTAWAVEAKDGRVRWQIDGTEDFNNIVGAPAPAINDKYVVFAFGSGAVKGAFRQGGLQVWNADLLGRRSGLTIAGIDDITGDPLIEGDTIYAGNHSGRTVALSIYNGERLWTAKYGALGPMWPAGGSVFFVSDLNELVRLDSATGEVIWTQDLPGYEPKRNPNRRRNKAFANHGPILAGGRLIVASSDGKIRGFNPVDGALVQEIAIPGGATTRPVVANGTLYVVSRKGVLHAYR